ncbi:MAG: hypothetical protein R3B45_06445 [Bdellovibrionota bacterium]
MQLTKIIAASILGLLLVQYAYAGPKEQAYTIFNRLNGVPPDSETLHQLEQMISQGDLKGAALAAINDKNGQFYELVHQNVTTWTNEDQQVRYPLTDYSATVLGMIRDELPFNEVLTGDIVYIGISPDPNNPLPPYTIGRINNSSDDHYEEIQRRAYPLHKVLVRKKQSELTYLPTDATAGILTTRGFARAYYVAGTNRAATRFTFMTFLCRDMEELSDNSRPDYRVRRDVSRAPAGDPKTYKSKCAGCHSGMDGHTGAFAYMDYTEEDGLIYNPTAPRAKFNQNADEFPKGYVTTDDNWINLWAEDGPNKSLGWNGARSGKGVKSWGKMLTQTDAFSQCMAQRALVMVCDVNPEEDEVKGAINQLAAGFRANNNYNMKALFAKSALYCRGK